MDHSFIFCTFSQLSLRRRGVRELQTVMIIEWKGWCMVSDRSIPLRSDDKKIVDFRSLCVRGQASPLWRLLLEVSLTTLVAPISMDNRHLILVRPPRLSGNGQPPVLEYYVVSLTYRARRGWRVSPQRPSSRVFSAWVHS